MQCAQGLDLIVKAFYPLLYSSCLCKMFLYVFEVTAVLEEVHVLYSQFRYGVEELVKHLQ